MKLLAINVVLLTITAPLSSSSNFHRLDPINRSKIDCGCTFFLFDSDTEIEIYVEGSEILVLDFAAGPPRALINLGDGNIALYPELPPKVPLYSCNLGDPFSTHWLLDDLQMSVDLHATVANRDSCWFGGELSLSQRISSMSVTISGACEC